MEEQYNYVYKHYNFGLCVYDYALNIWQGFNVKFGRSDTVDDVHEFLAQPMKDNGPVQSYLISVIDQYNPVEYQFTISTEYNPNGTDLFVGKFKSIKRKGTDKVDVYDFEYETDSGLKLDIVKRSDPTENSPFARFKLKILGSC